jgi:hypothetical protein
MLNAIKDQDIFRHECIFPICDTCDRPETNRPLGIKLGKKRGQSKGKNQALRFNPSPVVSFSLPVAPTSVSPFNSTLGISCCFNFSFSCSSTISSSSSSSSLLSSLATELLTNLHAILITNTNQNTLTACRAKSNAKVMICEIQHLYCSVSQLSS